MFSRLKTSELCFLGLIGGLLFVLRSGAILRNSPRTFVRGAGERSKRLGIDRSQVLRFLKRINRFFYKGTIRIFIRLMYYPRKVACTQQMPQLPWRSECKGKEASVLKASFASSLIFGPIPLN